MYVGVFREGLTACLLDSIQDACNDCSITCRLLQRTRDPELQKEVKLQMMLEKMMRLVVAFCIQEDPIHFREGEWQRTVGQ